MNLGKSGVNFIFACIVIVLALTAAVSLYVNSERQSIQPSATGSSPDNTLPENHPDIDVSKRITALNQMIANDPKNPEHQTQIANLYYDIGQYETAAGHYRQSLALRPENPNVETDLAVCLHYLGQDDNALQALDRVLAYSPGFSQALFNKGTILINGKKDIKAGIGIWEELLRTNPDFPQKAEIEQRMNQLKGSIR
jgi:tetratricopeptide (TPR) repeat protein